MAGIEEAFEKFSDRLARQESKRYARDEQGDYVEEVQDPYPVKLGPLQLGANANISTGQYSPNKYDNVSTMNRNVGLRGKYNVPDSGIALLGSIGDVRSSQNVKTNLPFNPMTGEASPYSEMRKDVYKDSPYSVGAQYTPQGTDEMYSALYNKGGGYNLGYNKGPVNVSYTSNPGLGNNVMLKGQYNFAEGGRAGYADGTPIAGLAIKLNRPVQPGDPVGSYYDDGKGPLTPGFLNDSYGPVNSLTGLRPVERKMGLFTYPDGSYPGENISPNSPRIGPIELTGVLPSQLQQPQTSQIDISTNPIAKALEMAGFTKEEIMRILGQQGLANGGRAGYADGSKPIREDSPILQINPMERDIQFSQDPTMEQMPNVGIAAIGLTKKAKEYNRYIKAFESNDPKVFKKWFDSQTKEFSKTKKLAEDAEMFELIPEVARGASKTEKQLANNQLRESMGGYYSQELGPYYSQEIGILDNLIFKAYGGRVSMSDGGLTTTIAPAKGPDSQGVESLFRRRYN